MCRFDIADRFNKIEHDITAQHTAAVWADDYFWSILKAIFGHTASTFEYSVATKNKR